MLYLRHMGGQRTTGRLLHKWRAQRGFTIVEVLIVLAITGALFVAAAVMISGSQNRAGFNQAVQQLQSQIQQVMNDVSTGYFPNSANFQCSANAGGPVVLSSVGANGQGANAGCIFAGKVLSFQLGTSDPQKYGIFTVAAAQKNAAGQEVTSLATAAPKVVAPGTSSPAGFPDITTTTVLQNGLAVSTHATPSNNMAYNNGGGDVAVGAVAIVPSFASYAANGNITSGSQQLSIIPITGTSLGMDAKPAADAINSNLAASAGSIANPTNGVSICFASGGTDESGLITIGGASHPLSVTLKISEGSKTCGK